MSGEAQLLKLTPRLAERICHLAAEACGVRPIAILSPSRRRPVVRARHAAQLVMRRRTGATYADIALAVRKSDVHTARAAVLDGERALAEDAAWREIVEHVERGI